MTSQPTLENDDNNDVSSMFSSSNTSTTLIKLSTSNRIQQTLDPCVILMKTLINKHSSSWTDKGGIYSLAQGIVHWSPPPEVATSISNALSNDDPDIHLYCQADGIPALKSALQTKLALENGLTNVEIMVTAGANQAYVNCVLTLLEEGTKGVIFAPYYFNHVMAIQMSRGESSVVLGPTVGHTGVPDVDWLARTLSSPGNTIRMVTIVNPGNPTGVSLSRPELRRIIEVCKRHDVWVIVDNTYEHFDHAGAMHDSKEDSLPFYCSDEENVINIFSFSKSFSMAGYRIGYLTIGTNGMGPPPEAYRQMLKVQDTIPICVSRLSQMAALGALRAGRSWVDERVKSLSSSRNAIHLAMSSLKVIMGGSGAMYLMGKLPEGMDDEEAAEVLVEKFGVAVIPGSYCGFPGWIRVCYSNLPPEECTLAAARLAEGIDHLVHISEHENGLAA